MGIQTPGPLLYLSSLANVGDSALKPSLGWHWPNSWYIALECGKKTLTTDNTLKKTQPRQKK